MIYPISDPEVLFVGDIWGKAIGVSSQAGFLEISDVDAFLYAEESTSDILSTYSTGAVANSGNVITTPLVGVSGSAVTILPGRYSFQIKFTYNGGFIDTLEQKLEFLERKG